MQEIIKLIKGSAFTIGGLIGALLGGWDMSLNLLVFTVVTDYVTGVLRAVYRTEFNKDIGYKGILRKINIFIMVAITCTVDKMLGTNGTFRTATIFFYTANEGLSIIKNISDMDTKIPAFLKDTFTKIKDKNDKRDDHTDEE